MLRVLVVEDDPAFREEYRLLLEDLGYSATLVASAAEAEGLWRPDAFDVVLLDQKFQGVSGPNDGLDVMERARLSSAKVILVTGYASEHDLSDLVKAKDRSDVLKRLHARWMVSG